MNNIVNKYINELTERFPKLKDAENDMLDAYNMIAATYENDGTLFVCGNGGSACDGEHIVGELMKTFLIKKHPVKKEISAAFENTLKEDNLIDKLQPGLRAISLNNHPGLSSAYINDVDPLMVYAQQLFVLGRKNDALIGISTSGNAVNVCNAFKTARALGIKTILLTGLNDGACMKYADCAVKAPSYETYIIQEYHLPIYHTLCRMLEEHFHGGK